MVCLYIHFQVILLRRTNHLDSVIGRLSRRQTGTPESNRCASGSCYSGSGTDVDFQIRFLKVHTVAAAEGSMRLKVR